MIDKSTDEFGLILKEQDDIKEVILSGCGRMIGPYPCCSVVEGDCLQMLTEIPNSVTVITDPPWGSDTACNAQRFTRRASPFWQNVDNSKVTPHEQIVGDDVEFDPRPFLKWPCIMWGANHFTRHLPHSGGWLVWDKRLGAEDLAEKGWPLGEAELAWSNLRGSTRVFRNLWVGLLRTQERGEFYHPTQKPIELMMWCIEQAKFPETVFDPYCGAGSTLIAAKRMGKHFLGMETKPNYVAITRKRLAEIDAQPSLFEKRAEQMKFSESAP